MEVDSSPEAETRSAKRIVDVDRTIAAAIYAKE